MDGSPPVPDCAALLAALDHGASPLPPYGQWPQSLRTALDIVLHSPMPMLLLWGPDLCQLYNDGFARLIHARHPQAFGLPVHDVWPQHRAFSEPIYQAVLQGEQRVFSEQPFERDSERPAGSPAETLRVDLTYGPVHDEQGQVRGILVTAIDAEQRRLAQAELQRRSDASHQAQQDSEERLQLALAATRAIGTWDWNINQDHFRADAHLALMHGVDPSLVGNVPIDVYLQGVHPDDRAKVTRSIGQCIARGGDYAEEYRLLLASGEQRWVYVRGRCYNGSDGHPARFMGASVDITERKCAEAALQDLNETLEQRVVERTQTLAEVNLRLQNEMQERERAEDALRHAQKMEALGQLTGGIAHDFNNMLTGIIGSLDLMQRYIAAGRSAEIGRFTEAAVSSAHRAAALTHRLLAFSRRQSLDRRQLDPNALVRSLEELLSRTTGEHIALSLNLAADVWPVDTDASQLESALLNLVINARDAMPEGGLLSIESANRMLASSPDGATLERFKPGDYVMISVSDNGTGMPPSVLAKAFEPFFTTKPVGQGTGLGLSMIYGFAQQSGGLVTLHSRAGAGTCVRLYLPRHRNPTLQPATPKPPAEAPLALAGESVLVVEDDPAVRLLVLNVLDELGYAAHPAADADAALRLIESPLRIDLLVTDVGLPGLNGRRLAEIARQRRPRLKVLFMTGYAEKADEPRDALSAGTDLIAKPFSIDLLANKIRDMIHTP
jgi:signal transduction histidine kinase